MDNNRLVGILLKLKERINKDDRQRLDVFIGDNITQRLQEDSSLRGNLFTILSLLDQDNITEEDMVLLINAFNEIQCTNSAQYLKQYMKRMQSNQVKQSTENLIPLLQLTTPEDEEKCHLKNVLIAKKNYYDKNNLMLNRNNTNPNLLTVILDDPTEVSLQSKRKQLLKKNPIIQTCLLLFIILSIILTALVVVGCFKISQLKMKYQNILNKQEKKNETIQYFKIIQWTNEENNQHLKVAQSITEESNQSINTTQTNYNEMTQPLTTNEFFEEDRKFTEGFKCGCEQWCKEHGSPYGVCGDGHACVCGSHSITKENVGDGCTCDAWCRKYGYKNGGICGDGYTCICSS